MICQFFEPARGTLEFNNRDLPIFCAREGTLPTMVMYLIYNLRTYMQSLKHTLKCEPGDVATFGYTFSFVPITMLVAMICDSLGVTGIIIT